MSQKAFTILFVVITVIAVLGIIISRMSASAPAVTENNQTAQTSQTPQQQIQNPPGAAPVPQQASPSAQTLGRKTYTQAPPVLTTAELRNKKAVIETPKGNIEFELLTTAPKAASNFIFLTQEGFYDGLKFHRVEPGFVIQGGDPLGTGMGGPGYLFKEDKVSGEYKKGVVAMAKKATEPAGTGGSQFFIMLEENALPPDYVIFGRVTKGQDVVDQIAIGDVMNKVTIAPLK